MRIVFWLPEPTSTRTSRTSSPVETQSYDALEGGDFQSTQSKKVHLLRKTCICCILNHLAVLFYNISNFFLKIPLSIDLQIKKLYFDKSCTYKTLKTVNMISFFLRFFFLLFWRWFANFNVYLKYCTTYYDQKFVTMSINEQCI